MTWCRDFRFESSCGLLVGWDSRTSKTCRKGAVILFGIDEHLASILFKLDEQTFLHCKRTRDLAVQLGQRMGLDSTQLQLLGLGALLHDVGKIAIPLTVLNKKTPLTAAEWSIIQQHPVLGFAMIRSLPLHIIVKKIVLEHHRWSDGKGGYPQELGFSPPPLMVQIVSIADVVDAMTSPRSYRPAQSMSSCLRYITENLGSRFSSEVFQELQLVVKEWKSHCSLHAGR